jgi:hypothetical protein
MFDKHRLESATRVPQQAWLQILYVACWIAMAVLAALMVHDSVS